MTVRELLTRGRALLRESGVPGADHDAGALLAAVLEEDRLRLIFRGGETVPEEQFSIYSSFIRRRAEGEPLQYILGEAPFYGHMYRVRPGVLIPRFDTEAVCEAAAALVTPGTHDVLDLCAGSGILGIEMSLKFPSLRVTCADISPEAAALTEENAARLGARVTVRLGDLFDAVPGERFDLIVSNPPYIPRRALDGLDREVKREPRLALDGGEDGLDLYRRILRGLGGALRPGGALCLECAEDQAGLLQERISPRFEDTGLIRDVSGHLRGVRGRGFCDR